MIYRTKVMLVDDDPDIGTLLEHVLTMAGYDFCHMQSGAEALRLMDVHHPDLLLVDVMMTEMNGFEFCSLVKSSGRDLPVIFLTARGDIEDKGAGFSAGADDYVVKPFNPQELLFRVEAVLRRTKAVSLRNDEVISLEGLTLDSRKRKAVVRGKDVALTPKEQLLLHILISHPGEVLPKAELARYIWGVEYAGETSALPVLVHKLRDKIEEKPSHPRYIQTVWHIGYRFGD